MKRRNCLKQINTAIVLPVIVLMTALFVMQLFPGSTLEMVLAETSVPEQMEEDAFISAVLETRTHLVTVPAVLSLDVVSSGGSGLYSYQWSVQYEGEKETAVSSGEDFSPHKEISVYRPGKLMVRVTVTDRRTGYVTTAVTDSIEAVDRTRWRWDKSLAQEEADAYFALLLPYLQEGKNPLQDEALTVLLQNRYREQNFTDTQITGIISILKRADPLYRDLYLLSFYEYTMFGMQSSGSGYIDPPNAAFVSAASSAGSFSGTYFHEAGHGLHMSQWNLQEYPIREIILTEGWQKAAEPAGNTDLEQLVMDAIARDVRSMILTRLKELADRNGDSLTEKQQDQIADALINGDEEVTETTWWWTVTIHPSVKNDPLLRKYYIAVRDLLSEELSQIPYSNSNMVGDLYGGMTNHKLKLPYGHDGDYWYTADGQANGMQLCEGWAEFFSAMIKKDSYYKKINAEYLPETVKVMEQLAVRLRDQYLSNGE